MRRKATLIARQRLEATISYMKSQQQVVRVENTDSAITPSLRAESFTREDLILVLKDTPFVRLMESQDFITIERPEPKVHEAKLSDQDMIHQYILNDIRVSKALRDFANSLPKDDDEFDSYEEVKPLNLPAPDEKDQISE